MNCCNFQLNDQYIYIKYVSYTSCSDLLPSNQTADKQSKNPEPSTPD